MFNIFLKTQNDVVEFGVAIRDTPDWNEEDVKVWRKSAKKVKWFSAYEINAFQPPAPRFSLNSLTKINAFLPRKALPIWVRRLLKAT